MIFDKSGIDSILEKIKTNTENSNNFNVTGGFQNSNLIIIAGRPAMGKTALALCLATNIELS